MTRLPGRHISGALIGGLVSLVALLAIHHGWPDATRPLWRRAASLLAEGALVASWIGLLLEINHFGHFYESQLAKALVSLDFLGKLQPETL